MTVVRRTGRAAVLAAVLLAAAACGDGSSSSTPSVSSTDGSTTPTTPTTPTTSPASTATTATISPSTSAPVTTGPTLTTRNVRVTLPAGWKVHFESGTQADSVGPSPGRVLVFVSDISAFGQDLDASLAYELDNQPTLRRQDDLTVDGVRGFVLAGKDGPSYEWFFGTVYEGQNVSVALSSYQKRGFDEAVAAISGTIDFLD